MGNPKMVGKVASLERTHKNVCEIDGVILSIYHTYYLQNILYTYIRWAMTNAHSEDIESLSDFASGYPAHDVWASAPPSPFLTPFAVT